MDTLTPEWLLDLTRQREGPCLSLYQATHRRHPDNARDPIRFGNLVRSLEQSLENTPAGTREALLEPYRRLAADAAFWRHTLEGLAVLAAPGSSHVLRLQRPVPDFAVVADSWHVKPLFRIRQTVDRFHVLCLTRTSARLFEGNRDALDEMRDARGLPATAGDDDIGRYFRAVDAAVLEHHSRCSGTPLVLAALPEHQGEFRNVSRNPSLLAQGIPLDPGSLDADALRRGAWRIVEPHIATLVRRMSEEFDMLSNKGLGSDGLDETLGAAVAGRVDKLLVDADCHIAGWIDLEYGRVRREDNFSDPAVGDALDDMMELVLRQGGQVMVVPHERMPTRSGLAAVYRY